MWTLFSALQSVALFEPFSPLRLSRGCNGFCNQESNRGKKKKTTTKKLKQNQKSNNSYDDQFAICACFTAVSTEFYVCSAQPSACAGIALGLNVFVLVGLFWSYQKKSGGGSVVSKPRDCIHKTLSFLRHCNLF